MKRSEAMSVGQVIEAALRQTELTDVFREHEACFQWASVVGPGVNRYTTKRYIDHGVMHVYISSGPLKSELQFMRSSLVAQINKAVGADVITDIAIH